MAVARPRNRRIGPISRLTHRLRAAGVRTPPERVAYRLPGLKVFVGRRDLGDQIADELLVG